MTAVALVAIGAALWAVVLLLTVALCVTAKRADEQSERDLAEHMPRLRLVPRDELADLRASRRGGSAA